MYSNVCVLCACMCACVVYTYVRACVCACVRVQLELVQGQLRDSLAGQKSVVDSVEGSLKTNMETIASNFKSIDDRVNALLAKQ